jgi:hypothetical protein
MSGALSGGAVRDAADVEEVIDEAAEVSGLPLDWGALGRPTSWVRPT